MSETKKTAQDYKKEYEDLIVQQGVIKARIEMRLLTLCKQHPNVIVGRLNDTDIKANSIANASYISRMHIEDSIATIDKIEKWIAEQNPVKQGKLFN